MKPILPMRCALSAASAALLWVTLVASAAGPANTQMTSDSPSLAALPLFGCPMAHCDPQMTDLVRMPIPSGPVGEVWHRTETLGETTGSNYGLGCAGNGKVVACSYASDSDAVAVYDWYGNRQWSSGNKLRSTAFASAPMVFDNGEVIACDQEKVIRFDAAGGVLWTVPLVYGGIPVSPVMTAAGVLILATYGGPIYALDSASGALLSVLVVRLSPSDPGLFETVNTPAVRGNRVYIAAQYQTGGIPSPDYRARLIAIDVDATQAAPANRLRVAWQFEFGGPSGASPLVMGTDIFFDGDRPAPGVAKAPQILAVRDNGATAIELWRRPVGLSVKASFARDPRPGGGLWTYTVPSNLLVRRSAATGAALQAIDIDALIGEPAYHFPYSATTIGGTPSRPVMILLATAYGAATSYVVAVDLVTGTLIWKAPIADLAGSYSAGQFPVLSEQGQMRIVFTTYNSGARAIGAP